MGFIAPEAIATISCYDQFTLFRLQVRVTQTIHRQSKVSGGAKANGFLAPSDVREGQHKASRVEEVTELVVEQVHKFAAGTRIGCESKDSVSLLPDASAEEGD
jgi:hypothetical protein